jgi:hypothetical protein
VVACPLVPELSRLVSGSCSSPRAFVPRFLQTVPRGPALALPLSFASAWLDRGLSPPSIETCPAHTHSITCRRPTAAVRVYSKPQAGGGQVERNVRRPLQWQSKCMSQVEPQLVVEVGSHQLAGPCKCQVDIDHTDDFMILRAGQ